MSNFYKEGLNFSCIRCSACCRHEPGHVFLRKKDLFSLEKALKMKYNYIMETYCRWIPAENGAQKLSLKEKRNFDCIFWDSGCTVYEHRPLQCRSFPFWPSTIVSKKSWNDTAIACPGINREKRHTQDEINEWLRQQKAEPVIIKGARF